VNYWSYTAAADGEVALSTCGSATFDTRISVYLLAPDCNNLECVAKNDDGTGCPNFTSDIAFPVVNGSSYLVAVHGFGGDFGFYSMSVVCGPPCSPAAGNDRCSQAQALIPALDDGSGVATAGDNTCAYGDENTGCDAFGAMQGVWYSFNSGPNSIMIMDLLMGTASTMNYALYTGGCSGLGALGETICATDADGSGTFLPPLVPATDYLLYVWNDGGLSNEGSFNILLRRPGMNDAAIDTILEPEGELCNTDLVPRVVLRNAGEFNLTSATIEYQVTGGGPVQTLAWTGDLAYQETDTIYLPTITTVPGVQTLSVTATDPNGTTDDLPANDQATKLITITGQSAKVVIATDNNPGQISWVITDAFGFTVASGGPYLTPNALEETTVCLSTTFGTCYSLYLTDVGGDGLCCLSGTGYWELRTTTNRVLLRDAFSNTPSGGASPPLSSGFGHEFCLPAGPSTILGTECNIFTNLILSKVYTSAVPGVLNYQFEFSDPDAGFRRRISVPRPWVAFSEMQTSPLVPGVVYFARARADQGASGFSDDHFGTGCEMGLDPNNVPGCTQLIDNPSLPTHSCGVTKSFGGSAKIWAVPVVGATQYRFNFSNPGEGYNRNVLRNSYVCPLSWVTQPLVNGSTYNVTVEVFANGVWGGFCGASCTVTILNPPVQNLTGRATEEGPANGVIGLYPNPVRDGRVQLSINGMTDDEQAITVEIHDLYGKRVMAEQFRNSGDVFNTVLELDGSMSAGMYLVSITVNGQVTTQRLNVM
jgi:Secretion system C-terminal sorting domain